MLPKEELLHHIWKYRLFDTKGLKTTDGQPIEVIKPGILNDNAGPDFSNARLKIGETEWAGNVEIHVKASDWFKHQHQNDPAYQNIILHVVYKNDLDKSTGDFVTTELKSLISDQVLTRYQDLVGATEGLPCGRAITSIEPVILSGWMDSLLAKRLMRKSEAMQQMIESANGDLEQAFLITVFRAFGMKVNADSFEQLARQTPWKVLAKHQDDQNQIEAILFGNAGMLSKEMDDGFYSSIKKEYDFLKHKYDLEPINGSRWKYLRLRPANFPTIRISQLAALISAVGPLLKWFSNSSNRTKIHQLSVVASSYWQTHYRFGVQSKKRTKRLGRTMIDNLVVNGVVPFLFVLAERDSKPVLKEQALELLASLEPEKNRKTELFRSLGVRMNDASDSQALIELKTNYCDLKKCLNCTVGIQLLKHET